MTEEEKLEDKYSFFMKARNFPGKILMQQIIGDITTDKSTTGLISPKCMT